MTRTWLSLMVLTVMSFALSDSLTGERATLAVLAAASAKSILVAFRFMGLSSAHPAWKAAFTVLLAAVVIALWVVRA